MKKFSNILILVLTVSLVWQLYHAGKLPMLDSAWKKVAASVAARFAPKEEYPEPTPQTAVAMGDRTPVPEDPSAVPAAKPAVVAAETPVPEATPAPTPAATPMVSTAAATPVPEAPMDLSSLERRFWPKGVRLNKAAQFAIILNGKEAGRIEAPAGIMVKLLDIQGSQLLVEMATGSGPKMVLASDTDIQDRVREIKALSGDGTVKPAASASGTPWVPQYKDRVNRSALHK